MADVVFSRRQAVTFSPTGADGEPVERTYTVAPLTMLEQAEYRVDLAAMGALPPTAEALFSAYRNAARELAPSNVDDVLATIDAYEALGSGDPVEPEREAAIRRDFALVEDAVSRDPFVALLYARRFRFHQVWAYVRARHALRAWSGPGLPPFRRVQGRVPDALLDLVPETDLVEIAAHAEKLAMVGADAEKNSAPPSPSSGTPTPSTAA